MVSFSCDACSDVLTKKKLDSHRNRCHAATFTCLDCMVHFPGVQYRSHTGALYKHKNKKPRNAPAEKQPPDNMALQPYVEDAGEDRTYEPWNEPLGHTEDERSPAEPPPEAPTPPATGHEEHVNVFDFLVATGQTPNASALHLSHLLNPDASLVRYRDGCLDPAAFMDADDQPLVQYGSSPVPVGTLVTPAPKGERRRTKDGEMTKDKKRKRPHVDAPGDQIMTDAPPVLHSGLTDGLKGLMRATLPPSPDYSGGDVADHAPASPLKKSKQSKRSKNGQAASSILDRITGGAKTKAHKKRSGSHKKASHRPREAKEPKLIEFRPQPRDGKKGAADGQMIVFKLRADAFLGFVVKGPESERGCSMNKALKRYHREREAAGASTAKSKEEKELWKELRLRWNERGEIVLFSLSS